MTGGGGGGRAAAVGGQATGGDRAAPVGDGAANGDPAVRADGGVASGDLRTVASSERDSGARIPRSALSLVLRGCADSGASGVNLLREAGRRTGIEMFRSLGAAPEELSAPAFWSRLDAALRRASLGSISYEPVGESAGAIEWRDSVEIGTAPGSAGAAPDPTPRASGTTSGPLTGPGVARTASETRTSLGAARAASGAVTAPGTVRAAPPAGAGYGGDCHFAAGLLRELLSRAAGRSVEVAEVRPCHFVFGGAGTVQRVQAMARQAGGAA